MNRTVMIFMVLMLIMTGCGDTNWFPENIKPDDTPTAFTFASQTNVAVNTTVTSAAVTITGIKNGSGPISVTGGTYSINGGAYTSSPGTVKNNDSVTVQQTSGTQPGQTVKTTLTIGSFSAVFTSTTALISLSPSTFTSLTNQLGNTKAVSDGIVVTGANGPFNVVATSNSGTVFGFSTDGGATYVTSGFVSSGQTINAVIFTGTNVSTPYSVSITIGNLPALSFTATTGTTL